MPVVTIDPVKAAAIDAGLTSPLEQMRQVVSQLPVAVRVAYAQTFATIRNLADFGDWEAVSVAIEQIQVPEDLQGVKSDLLAIAEGQT